MDTEVIFLKYLEGLFSDGFLHHSDLGPYI